MRGRVLGLEKFKVRISRMTEMKSKSPFHQYNTYGKNYSKLFRKSIFKTIKNYSNFIAIYYYYLIIF